MAYQLSTATSCAATTPAGVVQVTATTTGGGAQVPTTLYLLDSAGQVLATDSGGSGGTTFIQVPDGLGRVEWRTDDGDFLVAEASYEVSCGTGGGPTLTLDSLTHTDETSAGADGTATIQASGGTDPLTAEVVELSQSRQAASGQPAAFTGLPSGTYTVRVRDAAGQAVGGQVTIAPYAVPVTGCQDEYADNYDPAATSDTTPSSCTYTPRWRSAWGPAGVAVRVAAVAGQQAGYVQATLQVGFRPGHPLAGDRPLGDPLTLRATVGPDGYATFVLGPYLRSQLGAPDGAGGRRLDLNSPTAYTADLYVGYELRRVGSGVLLEHGYALNAAVPDTAVSVGTVSPFGAAPPLWPGFDNYPVCFLGVQSAGRYGGFFAIDQAAALEGPLLPCPPNPLPVRWLAPGGGYGFWVFQGKPALVDVVGDGQRYREALTGESRYSERGEARRTYTASSGPYRGAALAEGLATLARSPQVWVKPDAGSDLWVAVSISSGTFDVRRWGVQRNEISITFEEAAAWYAQGQ